MHVRYYRTSRITWRHCERQLDPRAFHWGFTSHQNPELAFYAAQFPLARVSVTFVFPSVGKIHWKYHVRYDIPVIVYDQHKNIKCGKFNIDQVSCTLYVLLLFVLYFLTTILIIWKKLKYIFYYLHIYTLQCGETAANWEALNTKCFAFNKISISQKKINICIGIWLKKLKSLVMWIQKLYYWVIEYK